MLPLPHRLSFSFQPKTKPFSHQPLRKKEEMPRETEEEMFRRLTSEARREARIEQQRDFERRRQRKLERRRKHEEEARRRAAEAVAEKSGLVARKMEARGRGILAKPRKRVMRSAWPVVVDGDVMEGAVDEEWLPLTRDVGTETDPIETCLLHSGEVENYEVERKHDTAACEMGDVCGVVVDGAKRKMCESEVVTGSGNIVTGLPEWEKVWEQAALETAQDEEQVEADRCHATTLMFM
ncbi:hypothetical protein CERZMDRAFT_96592 [Cercospora zeae-maydis SCOH1-5]|uniref:Uncharacterized protein n=1 Tax=Cercospora zeae-maydis SCOH1-5 TaxID=717836 RepID=A0A6A6FJX6_9PEZI|nr:hypothetical protein CERZMDRAFT_96592 [Cercospora zeae-maydis SCOH1-5]